MMNRLRDTVFAILAILLTVACSDRGTSNVLTVSVEPQRKILSEIVGDKFEVETLMPRGANPETFEPTMKARISLDESPLYFAVGCLPFEEKIVETLSDKDHVVDTSKGIVPLYGTHSHDGDCDHGHHHHNDIDPHTWASVKNMRVMARNMVDAIVKYDPDNTEYYTSRYNALDARLDSLDQAFTARLQTAPSKAFAVWHPSLSYFARDYGLEQISVSFENKEMSPVRLAEVADEARAHNVGVFFFQQDYDSRQAQTLNNAMKTKMITVNPLAYDWDKELSNVVDALAQ